MSYYMTLVEADFRVKEENVPPMLAAIKALGKQGKDSPTLESAMSAWGWEISPGPTKSTGYDWIEFNGRNLGDEDTLFAAIAPFVEEDCYLQMSGEDGNLWRWYFTDVGVIELEAVIRWEDSEGAQYDC